MSLAKGAAKSAYKIRIKQNIKDKAKWYYGYIDKNSDMTGLELIVYDVESDIFKESFATSKWGGSYYIEKEDCEIIDKIF